MINNFLINGFTSDFLTLDAAFLFKKFEFPDCNNGEAELEEEAVELLDILHRHVAKKYVSSLFDEYSIGERGMWTGVDNMSSDWHNDSNEEFNSNFLIYLDDGELHGNSIEIKTPTEEFKIYPNKNQFVWLNQNKKFQHRATHLSGPRRLLSFEFTIPAIK
jgi:hypothetical protein